MYAIDVNLDTMLIIALRPVHVFVQDLRHRVAQPLRYLFFAPYPVDNLMKLPENCRVMLQPHFWQPVARVVQWVVYMTHCGV